MLNWFKHFLVVVMFALHVFLSGPALVWAQIILGLMSFVILFYDLKRSDREVSIDAFGNAAQKGGVILLCVWAMLLILVVMFLYLLGEDVGVFLNEVVKGAMVIEGSVFDFVLGFLASVSKFIIIYNSYSAMVHKRKKKEIYTARIEDRIYDKPVLNLENMPESDLEYILRNK